MVLGAEAAAAAVDRGVAEAATRPLKWQALVVAEVAEPEPPPEENVEYLEVGGTEQDILLVQLLLL